MKIATGSKVTNGTAADVGIPNNSSVDKAIDSLAIVLNMMKTNKGYLTVTVLNSANNQPIGGILINGILDSEGNSVFTNEDGIAEGYISEGSQTVSISNYADIADISQTITIIKGDRHAITFDATVRNELLTISSSRSIYFSNLVSEYDVCLVGGGGGGSSGQMSDSNVAVLGGGGGGGGYVTNAINLIPIGNTQYSVMIGSGGDGGEGSSSFNRMGRGSNGGMTSFIDTSTNYSIASANGGNAPTNATSNQYDVVSGGSGNGAGGNGGKASSNRSYTTGGDGTGYIFNDTSLGLAGGGGGSGGGTSYSSRLADTGGSPNGGDLGELENPKGTTSKYGRCGGHGSPFGGGGAGGNGFYNSSGSRSGDGGNGGNGGCYIRWRFKS